MTGSECNIDVYEEIAILLQKWFSVYEIKWLSMCIYSLFVLISLVEK